MDVHRVSGPRAVALVAAAFLAACGIAACGLFREDLPAAAPSHGVDPAIMVEVSSSEGLGVRRAGDDVELLQMTPQGDRWRARVIASAPLPAEGASVQFVAGAEAADARSYVYGAAPAASTRVEVRVPEGEDEEIRVEGGEVRDRLWLAVIFSGDIEPRDVSWRFLDAEGATVLDGSGSHP